MPTSVQPGEADEMSRWTKYEVAKCGVWHKHTQGLHVMPRVGTRVKSMGMVGADTPVPWEGEDSRAKTNAVL
jgi:hypothetical protein